MASRPEHSSSSIFWSCVSASPRTELTALDQNVLLGLLLIFELNRSSFVLFSSSISCVVSRPTCFLVMSASDTWPSFFPNVVQIALTDAKPDSNAMHVIPTRPSLSRQAWMRSSLLCAISSTFFESGSSAPIDQKPRRKTFNESHSATHAVLIFHIRHDISLKPPACANNLISSAGMKSMRRARRAKTVICRP